MAGETNLEALLTSLKPTLTDTRFVYCTCPGPYSDYAELNPIASFQEPEGLTLVIPKAQADHAKMAYTSVFRCITLNVYSSLDAVGLTAAVATKLTAHGISANVIAAYFHDHVFVQEAKAHDALDALSALSQGH